MPLLSVIIPVYNEVKTINDVVKKLDSVNIDKEIIIVDDASSDGTTALLAGIKGDNIKVIYHVKNKGKGAAFLAGLAGATGKYVIPQDADLESDPQDIAAMVDYAVRNDSPVVFGSRFLKTWRVTVLWHYLVNKILTGLTNLLFGASLTDAETCYKLVKLELLKDLDLQSQGFDIDPEITAKLLKKGYKIPEIPVSYSGRFYHEGKKIGWQDGISAIFCLIRLRLAKG